MSPKSETTALAVIEDNVHETREALLSAVSMLVPSVTFDDTEQVKNELPQLLGKILALCWINDDLAFWFLDNAGLFLNDVGILLPAGISVQSKKETKAKPSITVFEVQEGSRYKRRIFKLSLKLIANR